MLRPPAIFGIALGIAAAMLVISHSHLQRPAVVVTGPMLPDFGHRIRSVVMQYTAGSQFVFPVYEQYLSQQSADFMVYLVCPEAADFDELRAALHDPAPVCRFIPIFTHHPMTPWSRDRWVALEATADNAYVTLLAPRGENTLGIWPQRDGDSHIADNLAQAIPDLLQAQRSTLLFDGGDFLADEGFVFVTRSVLERNLQQTVQTREELLASLGDALRLTPVLMENSPDHHAGMFMMAAGRNRMLVADPSLAKPLYNAEGPEGADLEGGPDFSAQTQARFDSVARIVADLGYQVTRIPVVPPVVGKTYITYVNVILDETAGPAVSGSGRTGRSVVYMPTFRGQALLNEAAAKVWESLQYEVRPIDCSSTWTKGGTLHCLVNVLQREG